MKQDLIDFLRIPKLVEEILDLYKKYGKMSAAFLAHKFKFKANVAYKIMDIITKHENK